MHRLRRARIAAVAILLALASPVAAHELRVPIELEAEFLRRAFVSQVYTGPEESAPVWDDGSGCNFLTLNTPELTLRDGRVRVLSPAKARVGTLVFGRCFTLLDWSGFVEVVEEARLEPGTAVFGFRVVDSNLFGPTRQKQLAGGVLWDWVKEYVHPRLETVKVDLGGPLADLRSFLPLVLAGESAERVQTILDSLALADLRTTDAAIVADLKLDVPPRPTAEPGASPTAEPSPEPTFSAEELKAWEYGDQSWDAFLTFVVKQAGNDTAVAELQQELFTVLLEARYDLVEALAPTATHQSDPVRALFVKTWERLSPVVRRVGAGLPPDSAVHYIGFVAASNALAALDRLGPDVGLEISSDGLRRLARIVAPTATADPLDYSFEIDPELRRLSGFGPPLEPPLPNPDVDTSSSLLPRVFGWLLPNAVASLQPDVVARLNRWVPARDELDDYLPLVRDLLRETSEQILARRPLDKKFEPLYRSLILATAWQESCWRQFIRQGQTIRPITSVVGAVGLMQVNQRVWRGMYDVQGLRGDMSYNAKAGAEIAIHYLADYAIKRGEHQIGGLENVVRATYCIYNGGPGAMKRYRNPKASREGKRIDTKFWEKFQAVKQGRELDVATCWGP